MLDQSTRSLVETWRDLRRTVPDVPEIENPLSLSHANRVAALEAMHVALGRQASPGQFDGIAADGAQFSRAVRAFALQLRGPIVAGDEEIESGKYQNRDGVIVTL